MTTYRIKVTIGCSNGDRFSLSFQYYYQDSDNIEKFISEIISKEANKLIDDLSKTVEFKFMDDSGRFISIRDMTKTNIVISISREYNNTNTWEHLPDDLLAIILNNMKIQYKEK